MKISIVIPVYNEAEHLGACLAAIASQTVAPYEVIVVDNNSADATVTIAQTYDFVKLLREPKQGVIHARTRGFDAARGDIIARIDADSLLPADWLASVQSVFADKAVDAVSGVALYYNVAVAGLFNAIDLFFRRRLSRQLKDRVFLWGANMAVRRKAWQQVRPALCCEGGMHEDYDVAIHLQELGGVVTFDERLRAQVSSRRIDVSYVDFMRYVWVSPQTYAKHGIGRRWHMYGVVMVCAIGYLPARVLHRGYDASQDKFSWNQLVTAKPVIARVDPTANVA
ncbi:MAG TPA: glycosyltransferase family A protein [Verrucomicrobiae bacterium]|jgi:glycosyltransferase involved in cell wall biosynthesis|nr:glycosyltransferase family A protein [Verrucomicrobiae bacterium]